MHEGPVFTRASKRAGAPAIRHKVGKKSTPAEKAGFFLTSLWVTFVIVIATYIACIVAFFGSCFFAFTLSRQSGQGFRVADENFFWLVTIGFTLATAALGGWLAGRGASDASQP